MSRQPKLYLALATVAALMALVPATSSAANFQWSATGNYSAKSLGSQVITLENEKGPYVIVRCNNAAGSGTLTSLDFSIFDLTVTYSSCFVNGVAATTTSPGKYRYDADGYLSVLKSPTFSVGTWCTATVEPQSALSVVNYTNNGQKVIVENAVAGVSWSTTGPMCPSNSGNKGTLAGINELERVGGGSVNWVP